jgi:hypothetical protein
MLSKIRGATHWCDDRKGWPMAQRWRFGLDVIDALLRSSGILIFQWQVEIVYQLGDGYLPTLSCTRFTVENMPWRSYHRSLVFSKTPGLCEHVSSIIGLPGGKTTVVLHDEHFIRCTTLVNFCSLSLHHVQVCVSVIQQTVVFTDQALPTVHFDRPE